MVAAVFPAAVTEFQQNFAVRLRFEDEFLRGAGARGVRLLCRVFSHSKSTGSPSNAMLAATWRGTSAQRSALRTAGFSVRHSAISFCQVIIGFYT